MPSMMVSYVQAWLQSRLNIKSERGAVATEYGVLIAFIAVLLIVAAIFLKDSIKALFSEAGSSIKNKG